MNISIQEAGVPTSGHQASQVANMRYLHTGSTAVTVGQKLFPADMCWPHVINVALPRLSSQ